MAMELSSVAQTQPLKIPSCYRSQLVDGNPTHLRQLSRRLHEERRLIAFAAMRDGREIGRVGFEQQALERSNPRRLANGISLGEREHAAEAQMKSEIQSFLRLSGTAGEAVKDS